MVPSAVLIVPVRAGARAGARARFVLVQWAQSRFGRREHGAGTGTGTGTGTHGHGSRRRGPRPVR